MRPYVRDSLTGLTAIAGLVGLAIMLLLFGELREFQQQFYSFTLRLDTARGLLPASPVTVNGVRAGMVQDLRAAPDPRDGVQLVVRLFDDVRLPANFRVHIDRSFVGDSTLELTPIADADLPGGERYVMPGDVIHRRALTLFDEIGGQLAEPVAAITRTADNLETLASTYNEVGRRMSDLLAVRTPEEVEGGAAPNLASAIARLDRALASTDEWLGDAELRADARELVHRAGAALDDARATVHAWREAAGTVQRQADLIGEAAGEVTGRLGPTLDAIAGSAEEIRVAAHAVNTGRGTLGLLFSNPDLYRALEDAARRLERTLIEAQLLIEKYRKEGVPFRL